MIECQHLKVRLHSTIRHKNCLLFHQEPTAISFVDRNSEGYNKTKGHKRSGVNTQMFGPTRTIHKTCFFIQDQPRPSRLHEAYRLLQQSQKDPCLLNRDQRGRFMPAGAILPWQKAAAKERHPRSDVSKYNSRRLSRVYLVRAAFSREL